jgi:ABC-2 type transport system ATP-binding protein
MEQVEEICNHIVLVNLGKKILDGTVRGIKQDFKENAFSIQLAEAPLSTDSNAFEVVHIGDDHKLTVKIKSGYRSNDVLMFFLQQGITIESFSEILPSLNDIFIRLVEGTHAATRSFQKTA